MTWIPPLKDVRRLFLTTLLLSCVMSCGGDICDCRPREPASKDFRHAEKHVPLPNVTPVETTVAEMLTWRLIPNLSTNTLRTGRELTLYHIAQAYLQNARLREGDCDIHLELSDVPAKNALRVIVETPVDSEYCQARRDTQLQLEHHGFRLRVAEARETEISPALPASVLGLAFQDFEHRRGSPQVATDWELHPAIVTAQQ